MASYLEFKRLIGALAGSEQVKFDSERTTQLDYENIKDDGSDIEGRLTKTWAFEETDEEGRWMPGELPVHVGDAELRDLYDSVMTAEHNEHQRLVMRTPTSCEVSICLARPTHFKKYVGTLITSEGDVHYRLDWPSLEYLALLLIQLIDKYDVLNTHKWPKGWENQDFVDSPFFERFGLRELLYHSIDALSLRIETDKSTSPKAFEEYRRAISFEYANDKFTPFVEFRKIEDFFFPYPCVEPLMNFDKLSLTSHWCYDRKLLDCYYMAAYFQDYYNQFLAFYHVLENLFNKASDNSEELGDEERCKIALEMLKEEFPLPLILRETNLSEEDMQRLALCNNIPLYKKLRERDCLRFVLYKYVPDTQQLRRHLNDSNIATYYQHNMVEFCATKSKEGVESPFVRWDGKDQYRQIANRIYDVRCALVHTKRGKPQYNQREDWAELAREIPLIRAIAEIVITNTAT